MMSDIVPPRRPIVVRASRDTLALLIAAGSMAVAIGYSAHNRADSQNQGQTSEQVAAGEWAGQLAALTPAETSLAPAEPLSSDALTVPKEAMALPALPHPAAGAGAVKTRACEAASCPPAVKTAAAASPVHRATSASRGRAVREASLIDKLNPLNHLPDVVKRPFASAGNTIVGWVKSF